MQLGASVTRPLTIEQTPAGMAQLRKSLQASGIAPADILIVMEATGSYWITLATTRPVFTTVILPQVCRSFTGR